MEKGMLVFADQHNLKNNNRYQLSGKLMNELFMKWMSQTNNIKLVNKLLEDCKKSKVSFVSILLIRPPLDLYSWQDIIHFCNPKEAILLCLLCLLIQ